MNSAREWILNKLSTVSGVQSTEPIGADFIRISRSEYPPIILGAVKEIPVTARSIGDLTWQNIQFDFACSLPKNAL